MRVMAGTSAGVAARIDTSDMTALFHRFAKRKRPGERPGRRVCVPSMNDSLEV
jgi:hypothetical protein